MQSNLINMFSDFRIELFPVFFIQKSHCRIALNIL
jgi:hypothetical protein